MRSVFSFRLLGEHLFDLISRQRTKMWAADRQCQHSYVHSDTPTASTGRLLRLNRTKPFTLTSPASTSWSTEEMNTKVEEICSDKCRSKTGNVSPYCSVISGQSAVVICQRRFNYKAGQISLSNKRPLLSSITSKNCSRRRRRRRRGVHQRGPWINDTAGEEMRGRTQAVETQHMTQSWKQEDLDASSHKAPLFHAFVVRLSAVLRLVYILRGIAAIVETTVAITPSVAKLYTPSLQDCYLVTNGGGKRVSDHQVGGNPRL